jgi:hypothetical protein
MHARRRRRLADLPRRGLAPKPQPCDLDAGTPLAYHSRRAPDQSRAAERRPSCLDVITATPAARRQPRR